MADISNLAQLKAAAAAGGTFTIAPGTYTLDGDITFGTNITIAHDDTAGDVTIDGIDLHECITEDCTATFSGQSDAKRIKFYQGDPDGLRIRSTASATTVTLDYCDFTDANTSHGLTLWQEPAADIEVTCNYCNCSGNNLDGFHLKAGVIANWMVLHLNNCNAYSNGSGVAHQGVTAHESYQIINMDGGTVYDNAGQGIAVVGGALFYATGVEIYGNGTAGANADVAIEDAATYAVLDNCEFHSLDDATGADNHVACSGGGLLLLNCLFRDGTGSYGNCVRLNGGLCMMQGCVIDSVCMGNLDKAVHGVAGVDSVLLINNVFYNCNRGVVIPITKFTLIGNIFHTIPGTMAIYTDGVENAYANNKGNGYNYFYECANAEFYDDVNGTGQTNLNQQML
jgi:hypothetical protein